MSSSSLIVTVNGPHHRRAGYRARHTVDVTPRSSNAGRYLAKALGGSARREKFGASRPWTSSSCPVVANVVPWSPV